MKSVATYVLISLSGIVMTPLNTKCFSPFFQYRKENRFLPSMAAVPWSFPFKKAYSLPIALAYLLSELNRRGQFQNVCVFLSLIPLISCRFSWFCPDPVSTNPSMCCRVVRIVQTCRLPCGGILPLSRTSCLCKHEPRCEREINTFRIYMEFVIHVHTNFTQIRLRVKLA